MKKSDKVQTIEIDKTVVHFDHVYLVKVGERIDNMIARLNKSKFIVDDSNKYFKVYKHIEYEGVSFYVKNEDIFEISISLFPNSMRFEGDIFINGVKIPVPFLSEEVQKVFPGINLQTIPSIYKNTYDPNCTNYYPSTDQTRFKIYVDRDIKFISLICLAMNHSNNN